MLPTRRLLLRDAYCSVPPIESSFRPPPLSRETEAVRPRAPLRQIKREVRESEASSVEFVLDEADNADVKVQAVKVEAPIKVEKDPRQLCVRLAAVSLRQPVPASSNSSSEDVAGPSGTAYRMQALRRIPSGLLGPADPPRGRGRPKGSKSRPRVPLTFDLSAPPERAAAVKTRADMTPSRK